MIGIIRLSRSHKYETTEATLHLKKQHFILTTIEKNEIMKRMRLSLLKYLVRDPIFN